MKKRSLFAIILSASLLLGGCANTPKSDGAESQDGDAAAAYPEKSVQFIIPYAAGGGTDTLCRLLASSMEKSGASPSSLPINPAVSARWA